MSAPLNFSVSASSVAWHDVERQVRRLAIVALIDGLFLRDTRTGR
jgi:hypothetical protein